MREATLQHISTEANTRVQALYRYQVLNTPSESFFRNVAETVSLVFNCTLGIISFVDEDHVFYKEVVARDAAIPDFTGALIPAIQSPCAFAIGNADVTVLDRYPKEIDPVWAAYDFQVTQFDLKFYAGAPLRTSDGYSIGMLAIVDKESRLFTDRDRDLLKGMAKIVVDELELRISTLIEIENQKGLNEVLKSKNKELEHHTKIISEKSNLIYNLNKELQIINRQLENTNGNLSETISERSKRLRNAYRQLIRSQKELEALIYNASHGLKSPLSTVDGLINLARLETADPVSLGYFSKIIVCNKRMHSLLHKLTHAHEIMYQTRQIDQLVRVISHEGVHTIIEEAFNSCKEQIAEKAIRVSVNVSQDISLPTIPIYLQSIISNLVENAVNFQIKTPSRLAFDESVIKISVERIDNSVIISCFDNGEGIPVMSQNRVFEMFYRASSKSGGGLGLFIVQKIVTKLNGKIQLESVHGRYTRFTVTLPDKWLAKKTHIS